MKKLFTILLPAVVLAGTFTAPAQVGTMKNKDFTIKAVDKDDAKAAEDSPWTKGGVAGVTLSQVSLMNWAAGGEGSVAFDLMFNYNLNYKKDRHLWQNRLELAYGMNYSQSKGAQKTNDKIYLASMYGYELGKNWYLSALMNFSTQFANGFDYNTTPDKTLISQFMAPAYLSVGLGATWKPKTWITATISPAMWRGTFVLDEDLFYDKAGNQIASVYGVMFGKKMLNQFGADLLVELNYDITKSMNIYSRLDLYSNYLDKPQNIIVKWDIVLTAKLTKWLAANLTLNMIYDDNVKSMNTDGTQGGPKFQLKEVLGVGLQASF